VKKLSRHHWTFFASWKTKVCHQRTEQYPDKAHFHSLSVPLTFYQLRFHIIAQYTRDQFKWFVLPLWSTCFKNSRNSFATSVMRICRITWKNRKILAMVSDWQWSNGSQSYRKVYRYGETLSSVLTIRIPMQHLESLKQNDNEQYDHTLRLRYWITQNTKTTVIVLWVTVNIPRIVLHFLIENKICFVFKMSVKLDVTWRGSF